MSSYFITRKGQGLTVDRHQEYKFQSLASGFRGRKVDPFLVQVDPLPDNEKYNKNTHKGQEFDIIIEGTLEITIEDKVLVLQPGDSIYFDSSKMHCMRAVNDEPCRFLCIVF